MSHEPSDAAVPVNEPVAIKVPGGQEGTVTVTPTNSGATFSVAELAISKYPDTEYAADFDGVRRYGPAPVPPTDPDDSGQTFTPPIEFEDSAEITISNVSSSSETYVVRVRGWEEP